MKNRNNINYFNQQIPFNFNNKKNDINSNEDSYQSKLKKIYEERQKIQNSIKQLEYEEKLINNKERNIYAHKAHMNYMKDPFKHMNLLLEQHFKNNIINDDEELKKFVKKDFDKFQNQIMEDFTLFKNKQKVYLEKLQDKFFLLNRKKNNLKTLDENAELKSEPLYNGENIKNIFIEMPQNRYNLIINSASDTKTELINNNESKFYKNNICQNLIQCMGNTRIENKNNFSPPINQFIEVNNAKISIDYFHNAKKEFNDKRENEKEIKEKEEKILNDETKNIDFHSKLFDTKYNNYQEEINELKNINEQNMQIIGDIKNKMTKDKLFDDLTYKQLNILKKSENEIKEILSDKNSQFNNFEINSKEGQDKYLKRLNEMKDRYEDDYQQINKEIENLKKKYKNKSNKLSKNKNRTKSSHDITKRKYYNDNPNHYNYNYDRASIPIKKILKKYE